MFICPCDNNKKSCLSSFVPRCMIYICNVTYLSKEKNGFVHAAIKEKNPFDEIVYQVLSRTYLLRTVLAFSARGCSTTRSTDRCGNKQNDGGKSDFYSTKAEALDVIDENLES